MHAGGLAVIPAGPPSAVHNAVSTRQPTARHWNAWPPRGNALRKQPGWPGVPGVLGSNPTRVRLADHSFPLRDNSATKLVLSFTGDPSIWVNIDQNSIGIDWALRHPLSQSLPGRLPAPAAVRVQRYLQNSKESVYFDTHKKKLSPSLD